MKQIESIVIRRIANARSLKLRVHSDGRVVLSAPKYVSTRILSEFVDKHKDWIDKNQSSALSALESLTQDRETLHYRGQTKNFRLKVSSTEKPKVEIFPDHLLVTSKDENHQTVRKVLETWFRQQAKDYLIARTYLLADLVNVEVSNISVRSGRTRWGSCTSRQTLSFNWRLMMAPDWVSDYVIYHELAHLTHLDHSQKFWQLVESYHPRFLEAKKWLKDHHNLLQF